MSRPLFKGQSQPYTLPTSTGSNGQLLTTDGSGSSQWLDLSPAGVEVTQTGTNTSSVTCDARNGKINLEAITSLAANDRFQFTVVNGTFNSTDSYVSVQIGNIAGVAAALTAFTVTEGAGQFDVAVVNVGGAPFTRAAGEVTLHFQTFSKN